MKSIFNFKSRKEWESFIWSDFLKKITDGKFPKEARDVFNGLLTENEKRLIIKRLTALAMIKSGKSYKDIGEILWISPSTISALKKSVLKKSGYKSSREYHGANKNKETKHIKGLSKGVDFNELFRFPFPSRAVRKIWKS
jgi:DNA-binding CsgD family transcriptional regulator